MFAAVDVFLLAPIELDEAAAFDTTTGAATTEEVTGITEQPTEEAAEGATVVDVELAVVFAHDDDDGGGGVEEGTEAIIAAGTTEIVDDDDEDARTVGNESSLAEAATETGRGTLIGLSRTIVDPLAASDKFLFFTGAFFFFLLSDEL